MKKEAEYKRLKEQSEEWSMAVDDNNHRFFGEKTHLRISLYSIISH